MDLEPRDNNKLVTGLIISVFRMREVEFREVGQYASCHLLTRSRVPGPQTSELNVPFCSFKRGSSDRLDQTPDLGLNSNTFSL